MMLKSEVEVVIGRPFLGKSSNIVAFFGGNDKLTKWSPQKQNGRKHLFFRSSNSPHASPKFSFEKEYKPYHNAMKLGTANKLTCCEHIRFEKKRDKQAINS